jgi:hypothetical protein
MINVTFPLIFIIAMLGGLMLALVLILLNDYKQALDRAQRIVAKQSLSIAILNTDLVSANDKAESYKSIAEHYGWEEPEMSYGDSTGSVFLDMRVGDYPPP